MSSSLADIALQVDLVDIALMTLLVIVAIAIIRLRDLFEVVVLSGIFSLLSACIFTTLDAVDVAFTAAAVGAGRQAGRPRGGSSRLGPRPRPTSRRPRAGRRSTGPRLPRSPCP